MADAAAFFAKKKKGKKKPFKFNANTIDATTVTQTVHVDAPALSANAISSPLNPTDPQSGETDKGSGEQWDDDALAATLTRKTATTGAGSTSELMDMKALDPKRNEHDNIAEKLRLEENKAKLAAAREGMEREAQRLKDDKEKKKEAASAAAPRFGAAAAAVGGAKWVPPHMRAGGSGTLPKIRMGAGVSGMMPQKVDTQDENLFPDLAAADAIIEQQQKSSQPVWKVHKKTPVGGGASWATKPKISNKQVKKQERKQEKKPEPPKKAEAAPAAAPAPVSPAPAKSPEKPKTTTATETSPAPKKPLGKKKKKDLSTFKA